MSSAQGPFGDCKNAILQHLGNVQENGALVAVHSETKLVEYCSANSAEFLGIEPAQILGRAAGEWLSTRWPSVSALATREGKLDWCDFAASDPLVVIGHKQGAHLIFEFERSEASPRHWWNHATRSRFVEQLATVHTGEDCYEFLARWVFERSGYDRVLTYRFLPDWHGEVVHEQCRTGVEGFLGLRFPASDIPPNARQMFLLNWQRTIVDVDAGTPAIVKWDQAERPLDLTYSTLRAAHPAHIQYLKNMGVQASFTLSMVLSGKLWGLTACHHFSARTLSIADRLALEEMARLVALHLTSVLALIEQESQSHMREQLSRLQGGLSTARDETKQGLTHSLAIVRQTFDAGGAWLRFEGEDFYAGLVPDKLSLAPLRDFLERFSRERISHYDALPEALRPFRALAANASGALFVPLGSADFITLLRPEVIATVNWAGKPDRREDDPAIAALPMTPRHSFAVWSERVRNTAERWTATELQFGEKLRVDLQLFLSTARLEQMALHDPLTGLANRLLFERRLQSEIRNSMAQDSTFAIYMVDLDRFKQVNDTFGHAAGDQLLTAVAARLIGAVRKEDTVARLGGDEFAILQTGLGDRASAASTAERIVQSVSAVYKIAGEVVEIGASVGVSLWPVDTVVESELLECADLALYQVKRSGRNAYSMYVPAMRAAESRGTSGDSLLQAMQDDEFRLNYQAIVDARSGELRGLEVFLRWAQPGAAIMQARELMPLVEQRRLGPAVGAWVMNATFKQYQQWLREGLPMVPLTINIGNEEFASQDLLGQIEKLGALYQTGWQWLRLDIKEQALMADVGLAIQKLRNLRDAGVGADLDDFGRGFVPLAYLTQLPFHGIKLDATLFENSRPHSNAMFNVVRSIAQVFSAQLTVTRIETLQIREMLRSERVDRLQGYAIARPAEASQAVEWLRNPDRLLSEADLLQK